MGAVGARHFLVAVLVAGVTGSGLVGCDIFYSGSPPPGASEQAGYAPYRKYCARCHGLDGRSDRPEKISGNVVSLVDPQWRAETPRDSIEAVIRRGRGRMKGLELDMTSGEIHRVVDYVLWMPLDGPSGRESTP